MINIKQIIKTYLKENKDFLKKYHLHEEKSCSCGCNTCENVGNLGPILRENLQSPPSISNNLKYHIDGKKPLTENTFRYGSNAFLNLWKEARELHNNNYIYLSEVDKEIINETDLGEFGIYEGKKVPLDLPMEYKNSYEPILEDIKLYKKENLTEVDKKKKNPPLNKPKRGGSKKFYVYVRNPKTKKIKKISFGDTTGLSAKINNPKARKAFAARHKCAQKTDRTKASYWSCRIGRYWKSLGGSNNFSGYW
jgi:hypothetical protein